MKPMTEYQKFREVIKRLGNGNAIITEKYVVIPRKVWDESQRQYQRHLEAQKAVRGN